MNQNISNRTLRDHKAVLWLLLAHLPFVAFLAPIGYGTEKFSIITSGLIGILAIAGYFLLKGSRAFGVLTAILLMLISATLIQAQLGRIEMHFHIFVALAFLLIFKDWLAVLTGAGVIAVHHLLLTYLQLSGAEFSGMPVMLYSYGCSWTTFLLHAAFVVIESVVLVYYSHIMKRDQMIADETANAIHKIERTGDFSIRVEKHKNHENVLAFNSLIESINTAIKNIASTLKSVSEGDLSQRVEGSYQGDLESLKQTINQTSQTLDSTMNSLNQTLDALGEGDFSKQITSNDSAQGDFKRALDNALETKQTLNLAVSEINSIVSKLAQSDFTNRLNAEVSGDLLTLKTNLNDSLQMLDSGFNQFNQSLNSLLSGDLTTQVQGNYSGSLAELQQTINQSIQNLSDQFFTIQNYAQQTLGRVNQLTQGNNDLSHRSQEQASAVVQTSQTMQQINDHLQDALEKVEQTDQQTQTTKNLASTGAEVMRQTRNAIEAINESSNQIREIITMIESIAFQTNLLALNAAVEAARAGEHGRGFAVVASEVRALAQKSADAAKEISQLIGETTDLISKGSELSKNSSDHLDEILSQMEESTEMVSEMRRLFEEQTHRVSEINQTMNLMEQTTEQNTQIVQQMQNANGEMSEQMSELVQNTSSIKTLPNKK